jgi:hypothetical protein
LSNGAHTGGAGAALTLSDGSGGKATVTLIKIIDPAHGTNPYATPAAGRRFVASKFEIASTGSSPWAAADSVIEVSMVGSNRKTYTATGSSISTNSETVDVVGCKSFTNQFAALPAGRSETGCVVVEVPTGVKVTKVVYQTPGGTAKWSV